MVEHKPTIAYEIRLDIVDMLEWCAVQQEREEPDMKIKTKVKAGPRDCGGGGVPPLPPGADIPLTVEI